MRSFILYILAVLVCAACSADKAKDAESSDLHILLPSEPEPAKAVRMPMSDVTTRFQFQGKTCEAQIFRTADETLDKVTDEQGNEFVDNRITLRITTGGRTLVERAFTKKSFSSVVEDKFLRHAILEGIVYDTITPQHIVFDASVSYPQSDLYVPIRLTISAGGHLGMETVDLLE